MSEKLKPCPFCGGKDIQIAIKEGAFKKAYCNNCYAEVQTKDGIGLVEKWNTRPEEDRLRRRMNADLFVRPFIKEYFEELFKSPRGKAMIKDAVDKFSEKGTE